MYRCLDCKFEFLNPVRYIERHSEDYREEWYGCPRCAGAYEELEGLICLQITKMILTMGDDAPG